MPTVSERNALKKRRRVLLPSRLLRDMLKTYSASAMSYTPLPPAESILGSVNREKKKGLWVNVRKRVRGKWNFHMYGWAFVTWKEEDLVNLMLCNFFFSPGEHMRWVGRGSHPSWAMVAECHSSSQIVVYNSGNSSVSHITPLEVTLSCRPRQHDSDGTSSARPMYSTVIFC